MQLVSMKTEGGADCCRPVAYDNCPCVYLDADQVKALGIQGMPPPGTTFRIEAVATVTRMSAESDDDKGDKQPEVYLTLKLNEMGAELQQRRPDPASVLYGG